MGYEQTPLRPIRVDYCCDHCHVGYMRPTGVMQLTDPARFPHRCTHCDHEQTFIEKYPTVRYVLEGQELDLSQYKPNPY